MNSLFAIPIQPASSQVGRCFVRQFIAYLESVINVIGMYGSILCSAISIADNLAIWLECLFPGILKAKFFRWLSLSQIPPPLCAFSFPLLMHEPLVKIVMWSCSRFTPLAGACSLWAGLGELCSGSEKILKHSARLERMVVVGLKRISPFLFLWA